MKKFKAKNEQVAVGDDNVKICKICKRTIMEADNKTGLCEKCTKDGMALGGVAALTAALAVIKKFGKPIGKFVINKFMN